MKNNLVTLPSFFGGGGFDGGVYGDCMSPGTAALGAYHGLCLGQACPLSSPSLSYIIPWCPRGFFWVSVARLRSTLFMDETCKYTKEIKIRITFFVQKIFSYFFVSENFYTDNWHCYCLQMMSCSKGETTVVILF